MTSYEAARRQCRTLETLLDNKLTSYSRLTSTLSTPNDLESGIALERKQDVENEIEDLLENLKEANAHLSSSLDQSSTAPSSSLHAVQRHREVLQDYTRDFQRTRANIQQALDQANLITNVRNDIDAYKSSTSDALLSERGRIDSSHRMIDDITSQAYETRSEFGRQRTSLSGINSRMTGVIGQMPGINKVIDLIRSRRRRDAIILGSVIGIGTILILSYLSL